VAWQVRLRRGQHLRDVHLDVETGRLARRARVDHDGRDQLPSKCHCLGVRRRPGKPLAQPGQRAPVGLTEVRRQPHRRGRDALDREREPVALCFEVGELGLNPCATQSVGDGVDEVRTLALHGGQVAPQLLLLRARCRGQTIPLRGELRGKRLHQGWLHQMLGQEGENLYLQPHPLDAGAIAAQAPLCRGAPEIPATHQGELRVAGREMRARREAQCGAVADGVEHVWERGAAGEASSASNRGSHLR
jgi:hypothetical protein